MYINKIIVYFIAIVHTLLIFLNIISIPLMIINEPIWIKIPLITCLVSPVLGGSYCIFNRIENYYREKANMPQITDRLDDIFKIFIKPREIK